METNEQENTNPTTEQAAAETATPAPEQEAAPAPEQDVPQENDAATSGESPDEAADTTDNAAGEEEKTDGAAAAPEAPAAPTAPDWKGMYARTMADFDNFRKRTARDREELFKSAATDILKDLLPTVDNLALALDKAADKEDPFVKGVQLVYDGLVKMLADHGAVPVDSLGEPLDTNFHEAIATLPSPEVPEGHVMTEVKRGWLLNGKVLRAAQVVVSAGKGE
jgi:molecular chaperone GrpE